MTLLARLRERLPDRRTCLVLGGLVAIAFVLDFLYFSEFFASDDVWYLKGSRQLANLNAPSYDFAWDDSFASTRLGVTAPDGLVYWLSDGDIVLIAWFHVLYHFALIVLAYAIGREVWDRTVGLLAAGLVATSPILYLYAGGVLPDNATAVWLAALLLMLLRARRASREAPLRTRDACRRYVLAGLVLGMAYSCKETAIIMTVPCAVVIMAAAPRLRSWVWVRDGAFLAAGLAAFFLFEAVVLRLLTDEWVSRLTGFQSTRDVFGMRMAKQGTFPHERFAYLAGRMLGAAPISSLLLLGSALAAPFLRRRDLALLVFFWWPFLYLTIGSTSFDRYRPSSIQERYYAIAILPAAVLTAISLRAVVERWPARGWATRGVIAMLAMIVLYEARTNMWFGGRAYHAPHARGFTLAYAEARARYPDYPIVLSLDFHKRMQPLLFPGVPDEKPGAPPFVLLSPVADALPEGATAIRGVTADDLYVRTVDIAYPPTRRIDILLEHAARLFGLGARPPPTDTAAAAAIQLVTSSQSTEAPLHQRLPLHVLRGKAWVTSVEGGNDVGWRGKGARLVQLLDRRALATAPTHPAALVATPSQRVRVEVDVALRRSSGAKVRVYGLGYDSTGTYVQLDQTVTLGGEALSTTVALDLESPAPIVAVRVRVRIGPQGDGELFIGNPRITVLGTPP